MSTTSFSVTRNDLINAALRAIGVLGLTQTPSTQDYTFASQALNIMIKNWMAKGATLWKIQEIVVGLVGGVKQYPLGPTAGYVFSIPVLTGGSGYTGASVITLSAPGTFSGFPGTTATATLGLTSGAVTSVIITNPGAGYVTPPTIASSGPGTGATYGTPVLVGVTTTRPLRVLDQGNFIRNILTGLDTPITMLGRNEYEMYGAKTSSGVVNSFFYDPQLGNGNVLVYPAPSDNSRELHLFAQMTLADMVNAGDTPDFPQEWYSALKYGLARELIVEYGADQATEQRIERHYMENLPELLAFSQDEASTYFTYDTRQR